MRERITFNIGGPKIRHATFDGRAHVVVPMVMMVNGVHVGSEGPLYYPNETLSRFPNVWNMKPLVVYHPEKDGQMLSGCDPDIFESSGVGMVMNAMFSPPKGSVLGRLKAEAWIDVEKANKVDTRIIERVEAGEQMEVSTGIFTENEICEPTEWQGEEYDRIVTSMLPDHLALLPDRTGACSIADGAGLLQNEGGKKRFVANQLSFGDITSALCSLIETDSGKYDCWTVDVYPSYFIYQQTGKLYRQDYHVDKDNEVSLVGTAEEVTRVSEYQTLDGKPLGNESKPSKKEKPVMAISAKRVTKFLANSSVYDEDDREFLTALPDEQFGKLVTIQNAAMSDDDGDEPPAKKGKKKPVANDGDDNANTDPAPTGNSAPKKQTLQEYVTNAPPEIAELLQESITARGVQQADMIKGILANTQNPYTEDELKLKPLSELRKIFVFAGAGQPQDQSSAPNYGGQWAPNPTANAQRGPTEADVLSMMPEPTWNAEPAKTA